jgi:hypothetical protein
MNRKLIKVIAIIFDLFIGGIGVLLIYVKVA